ncbi:MAG: V-type ATP synthase subunit I, partial [Bacteroidota bacterium]
PFFAPFFVMFFGFCLGDAGYGLIFILAATFFKPRVKKQTKSALTMIQYFGIATIVFGLLTGTLFGIRLYEKAIFSSIEDLFITNQQLFDLSVIVGGFHIIFGMCLKVFNRIKQKGFIYGVSTMGWLLLAISSVVFYLLLPENTRPVLKPLYIGLVVLSGIMIIFFSKPEANVFVNLGQGIWDIYTNVTGLLGDFLSYIRLFAIGISTAILGFVFNQMAISLSPDVPVIGQLVFVIILVFGHSINIFMSSLGSLVHPMRLIFVEFYKNAGFTGGGKEYKPFTKVK